MRIYAKCNYEFENNTIEKLQRKIQKKGNMCRKYLQIILYCVYIYAVHIYMLHIILLTCKMPAGTRSGQCIRAKALILNDKYQVKYE